MKNKLTVLSFLMLFISSVSFAQVTAFDGSVTAIAPVNNSVGQSIVPIFNGTVTGSINGNTQLQISTDNFSTTLYTFTTASSPALAFPYNLASSSIQLQNGIIYYWRVVQTAPAYTGTTYSFTTVTEAMPYLASPSNGAIISGGTTTFSWNTGVAGLKYDLQIALDAGFSSAVPGIGSIDVTNTTNTFYSVNNSVFANGTPYYWRVIAKNLAGSVVFDYSNTWQFTTPGLPQESGSYPVGGITIYNNPPTLYWYSLGYNPSVTDYIVRIKKGGAPDQLTLNTLPLSAGTQWVFRTSSLNTFVTVPIALDAGGTYYWDVSSYDGATSLTTVFANASSVNNFVVYGSPTFLICYPSYPSGGVTVTSQPSFYWYTNEYAPSLYYQLQISSVSNFGSTVVNHSNNITTSSYTVTSGEVTSWAPVAGNTYYWRVKGSLDGTTFGPWSAGASFVYPTITSTAASVATPYPATPVSGSIVNVTNPTLSWYAYSADPIQFQVIYSTDPSMSSGVLSNILISGGMTSATTTVLNAQPLINSTSFVLSGLTPGATYYWQVRAKSITSGLYGAWSTLSYFTTAPGSASVVPIAGSPINGTPINNTSATLSWILPARSASTLTYDVQYSKTADFSSAVATVSNVDKANVDVKNLDKNSVYYWRVASKTDNGDVSSYSAPTAFNTGANITGVEKTETMPADFVLSQNYPNPFNPTTIINFALPKNSFVALKVYDMLGREVKTLMNSEMSAGVHSVNWNADNNSGQKVTSGVYIYRISAGDFTAVKKMVLIK
jgi:FlgD Ig-like domain/Fibronectin type III domain